MLDLELQYDRFGHALWNVFGSHTNNLNTCMSINNQASYFDHVCVYCSAPSALYNTLSAVPCARYQRYNQSTTHANTITILGARLPL